MPHKAPRPCRHPGCRNLTRTGVYCDVHRAEANRAYDQAHRQNHEQHYGWHWRQARTRYIHEHPLCEECLKAGRTVPATEVHHIVSPECGGSDADDNLMSLCQSCHTKTRSGQYKSL